MVVISTLIVTGVLSAVTVAISSAFICARFIPDNASSRWWAPVAVVVAVALDRAGSRPLGVHRQVPQWWGHRYGPLAAAARYGPRLGVGPATILTTWLWWSGLALVAVAGMSWAGVGAVAFVVARIAAMALAVAGIRDGSAMARRMGRVQSSRSAARWCSHAGALGVALAAAALA